MHIPAYCSMSFLEQLSCNATVDYLDPSSIEENRQASNLIELINNGLKIKTNCTTEILNNKVDNPYIKALIKNNRILSDAQAFKKLQQNEKNFFSDFDEGLALFLLSDNFKDIVKNLQEKSGFYFITSKSDTSILFDEHVVQFKFKQNKDWKFAENIFAPHNAMIIADPYLFSSKTKPSLINFLTAIFPKKEMAVPYNLTLIGKDDNSLKKNEPQVSKNKKELVDIVKNKFMGKISVECHVCNSSLEEFHDRYLITNNAAVISGYGVDIIGKSNTVKKAGKWVSKKPFQKVNFNGSRNVFYINILLQELETLKDWIKKSDNTKTSNRLLKYS
jgi:hypothetical protein